MVTLCDAQLKAVYEYQMELQLPWFFGSDYELWEESYLRDTDGWGRGLFRWLRTLGAYDGEKLVGFVQFGSTAFGFDACGEISAEISYPVIRNFYFDQDRADAGKLLLDAATQHLAGESRIYAFFHYFGMSCFGRHGKLHEGFPWIRSALESAGFITEHENVYYSAHLGGDASADVRLAGQAVTEGGQQYFAFEADGTEVGGCEVHYIPGGNAAYLRWIFINDALQGAGIGTRCMAALKAYLRKRGIDRLDTDTALENVAAQHFYEKNGFARKGISRSYYTEP